MPAPIRFVYFDLDDTLLDHRAAERAALTDVCATFADAFGHLDVTHVQEVYHTHNVPLWRQYSTGDLTKGDLKRLRFERLLAALEVNTIPAADVNAHYMERYAAHWVFPEAAQQAFGAIAERFPVGILTNGFAEVQHAKLDRFPALREHSRSVVISEEIGYLKPHPKLFAHATSTAGVEPAEILYVGDSYHSDVQGSREAGWQVAWYTDAATADAEDVFCFDDWAALVEHVTA